MSKDITICHRCDEPLRKREVRVEVVGSSKQHFCSIICAAIELESRALKEIQKHCKKKGTCKDLPLEEGKEG